jgi:hypothetical protein
VNQSLLNGSVTVSKNGSVSTPASGTHTYDNNLDWVIHNGVGYFFPSEGKITLSNQGQSGSWASINTSLSSAAVSKNVFKLWFSHGVKPVADSYAYIIAPEKYTDAEMAAYPIDDIKILANTDTLQVVYHKRLNIFGMVFYAKAIFANDTMSVCADAGCVLMLKNVGTPEVTVHIADPMQSRAEVRLITSLSAIDGKKELVCTLPVAPYNGSSLSYTINKNTPDVVDIPTGVETTPANMQSIALYPNPLQRGGTLHLDIYSDRSGSISVKIMDMTSRTVLTSIQNIELGKNTLTLYGIDLTPGIYLISIFTQQGIYGKAVKLLVQ